MAKGKPNSDKIAWSGSIVSVQPRIRLTRSFDQRYHNYLGYVLCIDGKSGEHIGKFLVAVGRGANEKHRFCVGMKLRGFSVPVENPRLETASLYKTTSINVENHGVVEPSTNAPFHGVPPDLETYRSRGHRRLDTKTYDLKCSTCIWGCRMPVEIIIDQWNPSHKRYRFETFCYGPKSCPFYRAGPQRKVPGRNGMSFTEEDWIDTEFTFHRGPDE